MFLDHGLNTICSGDAAHYDYLIKREALIAQKRIRSEIALGLQTKEEEGTGKGMWARSINRLFHHAMQVTRPEHVIGKHNRHLETLLRLTADEALFAGDPRHRNALYGLITEPTVTIEPKFVDAYNATNHINLDILSNSEHFLPASAYARRLFVPTVSPAHANDHEYFRLIIAQLCNDGGYEALLYHLLYEVDISDFNVRNVPRTAMLAEQIAYSRKGVDLLVEIACNEARVPCQHHRQSGENWPGFSDCSGDDPRWPGLDYFIDHHHDRELARLGSLAVKRRLAKEWGCLTGKEARKQDGNYRVSGVVWPNLVDLRKRGGASK